MNELWQTTTTRNLKQWLTPDDEVSVQKTGTRKTKTTILSPQNLTNPIQMSPSENDLNKIPNTQLKKIQL